MSTEEDDFEKVTSDLVRSKILHVLGIYPKISPSMLQVGLGTALPPAIWHPIRDRLVAEGQISIKAITATTPNGRDMTYHIISLVDQGANVGQS